MGKKEEIKEQDIQEEDIQETLSFLSYAFEKAWGTPKNMFRDNILANIAVALTMEKSMKEDIQQLYLKDKYKYYNIAKDSSCYNHIIIRKGGLEQEVYAKRALGLLLYAEEDGSFRSQIIKLIRKHYPESYRAMKTESLDMLKKRYMKMPKDMYRKYGYIGGALYLYLSIYLNHEVDMDMFQSVVGDVYRFENGEPITTNIEDELKMHKSQIEDIKLLISNRYGDIKNYKDIINNQNERIRRYGSIINNLFIINKIDIDDIFYNREIQNVDEIILAYVKSGYKESEISLILQTIVNGIFIELLIKEYKHAREIYFENSQETLFLKLHDMEERLKCSEEENSKLKNQVNIYIEEKSKFDKKLKAEINKLNKVHQEEVVKLNNEIKDLNSKKEEDIQIRNELNELREFLFQIKNDYKPKVCNKTLNDFLCNKKIMIVGGNPDWRNKIKNKYPKLFIIDGFNENFDVTILSGIDFIFFYAGFMSHAVYYKIIGFIRNRDISFSYLGRTNIELVEREMVEVLERLYPQD